MRKGQCSRLVFCNGVGAFSYFTGTYEVDIDMNKEKIITGGKDVAEKMLSFVQNSPTAFHAVSNICDILRENGFCQVYPDLLFSLSPGGKYFITRNSSSVIAFILPDSTPSGFMICASHSDSPCFKLKDSPLSSAFGKYVTLNTEKYGGAILPSWFDRPLSVAGRAIVDENNVLTEKLFNIDRNLLVIPNVAIHMNGKINSGYEYNLRNDTIPLFSCAGSENKLGELIAESLGTAGEKIVSTDAFVYCRERPCFIGAEEEFMLSPRLDDLQCAFASLTGFLSSEATDTVRMLAVFDNEETGSYTKQGAASDFLLSVTDGIVASFGAERKKYAMLENSMMLSADNAHSRHPNHPELSDADNYPVMNGGVVIKYAASQKYTTDALSSAIFEKICLKAGVPVQKFCNRADMAGGSTLGSIADTVISVKTVDIGLAQLAMHSACETAGSLDTFHMSEACRAFFSSALTCRKGEIRIYPQEI